MRTFYLRTYGCQMNSADSERLRTLLARTGYREVSSAKEAEFVLVNSCSVREHAEQRVLGYLRSLRPLKKRGTKFCLCGCTANLHGSDLLQTSPFLDLICGSSRFPEIPALLERVAQGETVVATGESDQPFLLDLPHTGGAVSCGVSITKGCENFCSYCVVPFAKGKLVSRPADQIIEEIERLAEQGVREITLLGQNVNQYGQDTDGTDFAALLEQVHAVARIERIRFLTSHPKDVPPSLLSAFQSLPKLYRHLHLPLQSGSDRILGLMNRQYTVGRYLEIIDTVRSLAPDITVTSDIIVGFPTETQEDFLSTRRVIKQVGFDDLFVFKYSVRRGTAAADLGDTVAGTEKECRHQIIMSIQKEISETRNRWYRGRQEEILVIRASRRREGWLIGRTKTDKPVLFPGPAELVGTLVTAAITDSQFNLLTGMLEKRGRESF